MRTNPPTGTWYLSTDLHVAKHAHAVGRARRDKKMHDARFLGCVFSFATSYVIYVAKSTSINTLAVAYLSFVTKSRQVFNPLHSSLPNQSPTCTSMIPWAGLSTSNLHPCHKVVAAVQRHGMSMKTPWTQDEEN